MTHDLAGDVFRSLTDQPPDALLATIGLHARDPRDDKLDLGVGVYRDDGGATPIMRAVKAAELLLAREQTTKAYLGAEGDVRFTELLAPIVFGDAMPERDRSFGLQTPGGTGALRLGAELLARARAGTTVWIGIPTWPNHAPIFREAGLSTATHRYRDARHDTIDIDGMLADLERAQAGDVLLLHGCCHNPTGADPTHRQWHAIAELVVRKRLIPFVDLAYQGLGRGLDEDAAGAHELWARAPVALLAYSCDKNFALYRERVGALWVKAGDAGSLGAVRSNLLVLARSLWSMPPDHGAASVRVVLASPDLKAEWAAELSDMRVRLNTLRSALAAAHPRLATVADQYGLFAMLPIDEAMVVRLREEHAIYMPASGRINIAGLDLRSIPRFVAAVAPLLDI